MISNSSLISKLKLQNSDSVSPFIYLWNEHQLKPHSDDVCVSLRCLTAAARSSRTSTRQPTLCTAHRVWPSPPTDTLWSQTLETTASRSTATCSSPSPCDAQTAHLYRNTHMYTHSSRTERPGTCCTHPFLVESCCRCAVCPTVLHVWRPVWPWGHKAGRFSVWWCEWSKRICCWLRCHTFSRLPTLNNKALVL